MLKPFRASDGTLLQYFDHGHGRLVIFQHGFAMDHRQILETWPDLQDSRLVCLETRAHGFSELGPRQELSFQRAVMDLHELIDHLGEDPQIMGGDVARRRFSDGAQSTDCDFASGAFSASFWRRSKYRSLRCFSGITNDYPNKATITMAH